MNRSVSASIFTNNRSCAYRLASRFPCIIGLANVKHFNMPTRRLSLSQAPTPGGFRAKNKLGAIH